MWSKPFSSLKDMYIDVKKLKQLLVQKKPRFFNKKKKNLQILLAKLVERQIIYEKLVSQASFKSRKKQPKTANWRNLPKKQKSNLQRVKFCVENWYCELHSIHRVQKAEMVKIDRLLGQFGKQRCLFQCIKHCFVVPKKSKLDSQYNASGYYGKGIKGLKRLTRFEFSRQN